MTSYLILIWLILRIIHLHGLLLCNKEQDCKSFYLVLNWAAQLRVILRAIAHQHAALLGALCKRPCPWSPPSDLHITVRRYSSSPHWHCLHLDDGQSKVLGCYWKAREIYATLQHVAQSSLGILPCLTDFKAGKGSQSLLCVGVGYRIALVRPLVLVGCHRCKCCGSCKESNQYKSRFPFEWPAVSQTDPGIHMARATRTASSHVSRTKGSTGSGAFNRSYGMLIATRKYSSRHGGQNKGAGRSTSNELMR